jgi:hypothetical protein
LHFQWEEVLMPYWRVAANHIVGPIVSGELFVRGF